MAWVLGVFEAVLSFALCSIIWLAMPHRPLRLRDTRYAALSGTANAVGNAR
jgi:hypothetical protein